jgi:ferredoxin
MDGEQVRGLAVDADLCCGYGECVLTAPELFGLGEDGTSHVVTQPQADGQRESAHKAADLCPAGAISWNESG